MHAFVSWSGGKESCLSLYKTINLFKIKYLLNMTTRDGKYSRSHGIKTNLLKLQAQALGIPIVQKKTTWDNYEQVFRRTITRLNIDTGIFGDIDLQDHLDWVERTCKETGVTPVLPLWHQAREELLNSFIKAGFRAIIITVNTRYLGKEWLGRQMDKQLIKDLKKRAHIDLAGEKGEYHTFVFDGPIFRWPVNFSTRKQVCKDEYCFLDLAEW